jgi:hypothetical protein
MAADIWLTAESIYTGLQVHFCENSATIHSRPRSSYSRLQGILLLSCTAFARVYRERTETLVVGILGVAGGRIFDF